MVQELCKGKQAAKITTQISCFRACQIEASASSSPSSYVKVPYLSNHISIHYPPFYPTYLTSPTTLEKRKTSRASKYRGVSKNGNQWQSIIMVTNKKRYIGSFPDEIQAAKAYDIAALINHTRRVTTNFKYTEDEKASIKKQNLYNFKDKDKLSKKK